MNYKIIIPIVLFIIFTVILIGYISRSSELNIDEAKYESIMKQPDSVILDVRTASEFSAVN